MNKLTKILITIISIAVYLFVAVLFTAIIEEGGSSPTFINIILLLVLIFALRGLWNKDKNDNNDDKDNTSILQK